MRITRESSVGKLNIGHATSCRLLELLGFLKTGLAALRQCSRFPRSLKQPRCLRRSFHLDARLRARSFQRQFLWPLTALGHGRNLRALNRLALLRGYGRSGLGAPWLAKRRHRHELLEYLIERRLAFLFTQQLTLRTFR